MAFRIGYETDGKWHYEIVDTRMELLAELTRLTILTDKVSVRPAKTLRLIEDTEDKDTQSKPVSKTERKRFIDIQNEVIQKYRIDICDGTKCKDGDWSRTHAHVKIRRVCKWKQANSIQSTFTLFHEIGHIETTKSSMRRAESEYYATVWALERCKEYGLTVPEKVIKDYQDYIDMEIARGKRRGGSGYGRLILTV